MDYGLSNCSWASSDVIRYPQIFFYVVDYLCEYLAELIFEILFNN